jgi:UDP-N-acetylmuramate dehydrogenase
MSKLYLKLKKNFPNLIIYQNQNLKEYHSYHIECYAKILIKVNSEKELINVIKFLKSCNHDYLILGGGSNVLFKNKKVNKVVIIIGDGEIRLLRNNRLKVFAGVRLKSLLDFCALNSLSGLEWCARIPASIGGAVNMNMGSFNFSIGDFVESVTYFDGKNIRNKKIKSSDFCYRSSFFRVNNYLILKIVLKLKLEDGLKVVENIKYYSYYKAKTQPIFDYSCGSIFKNGKNYYVAELIEKCGLKGFSIGGAEISNLHSNFILNKNNATSGDVLALIKYVKKVIQKRYNICILCEVVVL